MEPPDLRRQEREREGVTRYERVAKMARLSLEVFCPFVLRDRTGRLLSMEPIHFSWLRFIQWCWRQSLHAGILAPFGHGKTLLCVVGLALFEIGQNSNNRTRVISGDEQEAVLRVLSIRRYLEGSLEYRMIFPHVREDLRGEWSAHRLFVERTSKGPDPTIDAVSVFSHEAGGRADLLIFDDVVTFANTIRNPASRPVVLRAVQDVWLQRVEPTTRVVWVGTAWHAQDAAHQLMGTAGWCWLIQGISDDFRSIECRIV